MKKLVLSLVSLVLLVSLAACGDKGDSLTYLGPGDPPRESGAEYSVQLGTNASQAAVTAELWENGICTTKNPPMTLSKEATQLAFSVNIVGVFDGKTPVESVTVQLESDAAGTATVQFDMPQVAVGSVFAAYTEKEPIPADAGTDFILGVANFDTGPIPGITPQDLQKNPDLLKEAPCILVIRVAFKM